MSRLRYQIMCIIYFSFNHMAEKKFFVGTKGQLRTHIQTPLLQEDIMMKTEVFEIKLLP